MVHQTFERKPPVVYDATESHEFTFIFLHGRGEIPSDFSERLLASQCSIGKFGDLLQHVKMIFPHAGIRTYNPTIDNQWFDIDDFADRTRGETQQTGLREHAMLLKEIVDHEIQIGIPSDKIILYGFSQGCAQALFTLLTTLSQDRLGAVIGMSGWLPFYSDIKTQLSDMTEATSALKITTAHLQKQISIPSIDASSELQVVPILLGHGTRDGLVDVSYSESAHEMLKSFAMPVEIHVYRGLGHEWTSEYQLNDILSFLESKTALKLPSRHI